MIRILSLAATAAVLLAPAAQAQGTASRGAVNDSLFAAAAAAGGMAELQISELGVQKATDPDLKRFSQRMIDEHTRMNQELATLAAQKRIALPRTLDACAQFCSQSLAGLSGEEFDQCYAKAQLVAHMDAVATFKAEAERGMDPQMKALAAKALPHIEEHLKTIKPIAMRFEKETGRGTSER
jgi:putative membrane protein